MRFKGLIYRIVVFVTAFIAFDQLAGLGFRMLNANAGDKFERENYMRYNMKTDVIVMGSSKAVHQYVPAILTDSLKMSAYNCGQRGNGVVYEFGRLATIYERYTPKLIIVDVVAGYDIMVNDNSRYLDFLKVDYGTNRTVDSLFDVIDCNSKYKMWLNSYRYNSTICDLLINTMTKSRGRFQKDGYAPLMGCKLDKSKKQQDRKMKEESIEYDSLKLNCLERIARERREGCKMVFVLSPTYYQTATKAYDVVYDICRKYNIPVLNYMNDSRFLGKDEFFYDASHLNDNGARKYTSIVASDIQKNVY